MSFDINEYYSKLSQGEVLLAYKGSITSELINELLEAVEEKLEKVNPDHTVLMFTYKVKTIFGLRINKLYKGAAGHRRGGVHCPWGRAGICRGAQQHPV